MWWYKRNVEHEVLIILDSFLSTKSSGMILNDWLFSAPLTRNVSLYRSGRKMIFHVCPSLTNFVIFQAFFLSFCLFSFSDLSECTTVWHHVAFYRHVMFILCKTWQTLVLSFRNTLQRISSVINWFLNFFACSFRFLSFKFAPFDYYSQSLFSLINENF